MSVFLENIYKDAFKKDGASAWSFNLIYFFSGNI